MVVESPSAEDDLSTRRVWLWSLFCLLSGGVHAQISESPRDDERRRSVLESVPGFSEREEARSFMPLCQTVFVENLSGLNLGDMEKRLLCGDPEKDKVGVPWSQIPPSEASFFVRGFLQRRGYHHPSLIQDGTKLFIRPGAKSRLREFRIMGGPETWDPPKRRLIRGRELTPGLLDELQGWALNQIKNEGFACAKAQTRADPMSGEVVVFLSGAGPLKIVALEEAGESGLRQSALNRYNAFILGETYRENLITLTRRRTVDEGFLQNLTLSARCEEEGVTVVRDVVLGPSRQLRVGVGASTEEGARVRVITRQARIGDEASWAQARASASFKRQSVDTSFRWYYAPGEPRSYWEPLLLYQHEQEAAYETQTVEAKVLHGHGWELSEGQLELRMGPNVLSSFLTRGTGPSKTTVFLGEGVLRWLSHDFEYWTTSPRDGSYLETTLLVTQKSWGANFTAQKVQLQGQKLWSIFRFDPPILILALRGSVSSVFSPDPNITADLPVRFLTFAGGEADLRGYEPRSLPREGVGALSGVLSSLEARLHKVIFQRADVFWFVDAGMLGDVRFDLKRPLFTSPGVGFRWESPVGVFRAYAAQRVTLQAPEEEAPYDRQWRYGLTYGEEF